MQARAHATLDASGALAAELAADFRALALRAGGVQVSGSGRIESSVRQPNLRRGEGRLESVSLLLDRAELVTPTGGSGPGWVRAKASAIPYDRYVPQSVAAEVQAGFPQATQLLSALGVKLHGVPKLVAKHLNLSNLEIEAGIRHAPGLTEVELERARTPAIQAHGTYRKSSGPARGAFLLISSLLKVGIEIRDGGTHVHPLASEAWLARTLAGVEKSAPVFGPRPAPARVFPR